MTGESWIEGEWLDAYQHQGSRKLVMSSQQHAPSRHPVVRFRFDAAMVIAVNVHRHKAPSRVWGAHRVSRVEDTVGLGFVLSLLTVLSPFRTEMSV